MGLAHRRSNTIASAHEKELTTGRVSVFMSFAKTGWVDRMRAIGRVKGVVVMRLDFSEAGHSIRIVMVSGIVLLFQLGVIVMLKS